MKIADIFRQTTYGATWYISLVIVLPLASLSILGIIYLWQQGHLLSIAVAWLAFTLIGYGAFLVWPLTWPFTKKHSTTARKAQDDLPTSERLPERLESREYWTEQDQIIWRNICVEIDGLLAQQSEWETLPTHALSLLATISSHYQAATSKNKISGSSLEKLAYEFTLPEALLVLSVASTRYRKLLVDHIPFAEKLKVSTVLKLYDHKQNIETGFTWFTHGRRLLRLTNPLAAVVGELKDQLTNRVFNQLSVNVQTDLKRLLLQEVAQVGIDLYSGKLKTSSSELSRYESAALRDDATRQPAAPEPLRIVLLGQSSSGKSSLINALSGTLKAEVDHLPTTQSAQTHVLKLESAAPIHLIDTVGLEESASSMASLTNLAVHADLIVFLARATQPARGPDHQLYESIRQYFQEKAARRQPPLLLVMSHIDQLRPKNQWDPPYDLNSNSSKAQNIAMALRSSIDQIGLPEQTPAVPVCLSPMRGFYNVDAVAAQLMMLQDSATLAQWNRRRNELGQTGIAWTERWSQVKRLGRVLGRSALN